MDLKMMDLAAAFDLDTDSDEDGKVRDSNGVMERAPTQNVAASLAGPSTGGVGGPVPEFVQRLLAEELKEWTLAQGESLSSGVQSDMQLDYAARLQTLAQLPCRADDAVRNDCNRLQEPSAEPEQWPPQQDARSQAQTWAAATGEDDDALGEDDDDANLAAHALCNSLGRLPYSWPPERPKVAPKAEARRVEWTSAEDELIRNSVQRLGCKKWRAIAAQLPGRSDDAVRNRWSRLQQSKDDTWIYLCSKGCGQSFVHGPGRASHEKTCSHAAVRAQASEPGYAALTIQAGVYKAKVWRGGKYEHLGNFSTAEEAALCVARSQEGQPAAQRSECTRKPWTGREDDIIMQSVAELGHKWTEHAIRNRWSRLQSIDSNQTPTANSGGAGEVGAAGSHEMLVPIAVPKLAHDDAAEHLTRGDRSHPAQSVTVHSATPAAFPSNAAKRAAPPPELPPNKQPCLASSARPLQAFTCRHPACGKAYGCPDAVRKHCRKEHSDWLRSLPDLGPTTYCSWEEKA